MQINLIIEEEEIKEKIIYKIYLSNELLEVCENPESVEEFLKEFEKTHSNDSVILRFS